MWSGRTVTPSVTSCTGILVVRARIWRRSLGWVGSRCCTNTNAMPLFCGSERSNSEKASRPPAEAPMPTMGNDSGWRAGNSARLADFTLATEPFMGTACDESSGAPGHDLAEKRKLQTDEVQPKIVRGWDYSVVI